MKRAGRRKKKTKLKFLKQELEAQANKLRFENKRIKDQEKETQRQWKEIEERLQ